MRIIPISLREANDFVAAFHRHNGRTSRNGGKFAIGLLHDDEMVGVAIVGRPLSRILASDGVTAEVLRTCTNEKAPKGAISKLYSHCWQAWRAMGGERMVTYTLHSESGSSLRGAGWDNVAEVPARRWDTRKDSPHIKREWQPVYGQKKFRWEISC